MPLYKNVSVPCYQWEYWHPCICSVWVQPYRTLEVCQSTINYYNLCLAHEKVSLMIGEIPSSVACHSMDAHGTLTQFNRQNVVGNDVVLPLSLQQCHNNIEGMSIDLWLWLSEPVTDHSSPSHGWRYGFLKGRFLEGPVATTWIVLLSILVNI